MKLPALVSIASLLLPIASASLCGAEPDTVPRAVLDELRFMVGNWQEFPEGAGAAERVLVHKREWLPGKHGLLVTWSGIFDGVKVDASGIVGYDSTTNCVTEHWYLTDGTYMETRYPVEKLTGSAWEGTTSWVEHGKKSTGTCRLQKEGEDQFVWTANVKIGDEVQPLYKAVTRRIADGKPSSDAPALLKEYAELMVGEWECKACVSWGAAPGSDKVPARAMCCWAADGAGLNWNLQIGEGKAQFLTYWDPASSQLKEFGIGSSGAIFEIVLSKEADKWINEGTMTLPDGKRLDIRTVTSFEMGGDTHVNDYPTHKDVFTRVKR